ncbi:MAG: hypothetical protein VKN72_13250 [Nostocales cyanobacterium 94392]|nr:hypothetical protein [Nostocales cyanobacterium 94392]
MNNLSFKRGQLTFNSSLLPNPPAFELIYPQAQNTAVGEWTAVESQLGGVDPNGN